MKEFNVEVKLSLIYTVKANSKEEAFQTAGNYWLDSLPETITEDIDLEVRVKNC